MAYIDRHQQQGGYPPNPPQQQPIGPPPTSVLAFRPPPPAFCRNCFAQFDPNLAVSGLCPRCTHILQPSRPQPSRPQPLTLSCPLPPSTPDKAFAMSNMFHAIEDVFNDQENTIENNLSKVCVCGNSDSILTCGVCQALVCDRCLSDHFQDHVLYSNDKTRFEDSPSQNCTIHKDVQVAFFCQSCLSILCSSCLSDHAGHTVLSIAEAYSRYRPSMEQLRSKSQVEINLLDLSLADAERMCSSVGEKQSVAVETVQKLFQEYRTELDKREKEVISQINSIADVRQTNLAKDISTIKDHLSLLKTLSEKAESAHKLNKQAGILNGHFKLLDSLQKYRSVNRNPSEDDSFIIKPNASAAEEALKNLCAFTTAPHPPLCTAVGEGLFHPRLHRLCTVTLCTKDRRGENCLEGGERLFVQLKSVSGSGTLSVDVRDNNDGSYSINFRPTLKGEHQMVIAIRGQHIQGSPFTLTVDGGREYGRCGLVTHIFGSEGSKNGQFCRPWGICSDHHGNLIIGDRSNHRVQVFDSQGVFKHSFGSEGNSPGQFNRPAGVSVTREGNIVVADKDNHRIQVFQQDGTFLFMFGSKGGNDGQMIYPYDVTVNQLDGRIAVTDTGNHRLLIFSYDGVLLGKFGYKGYLCGHFDSPRGIAFNDDGHIIISDFNVHHILVIHPDGTTARILGSQGNGVGQFLRPQGIAVDHMGYYIVADTRNNRVVVMHPNGQFIAKFGSSGSGPGQFDRPTSIAVLPDGRIAVVDFGNSRVQIF